MPRPQFTLRALLVAMLVVGAFFGGICFERERKRREDERAATESARKRRLQEALAEPIQLSPFLDPRWK